MIWLGQFLIAMVTLIVATIIYRWQRLIDRETAIQSELRKLYAEYIASLTRNHLSQPYVGDPTNENRIKEFYSISEKEQELYILRDQIYLLAPDDVLEALANCDRAFRAWKIAFPAAEETSQTAIAESRVAYDELLKADRNLRAAMRKSLQAQTRVDLGEVLKNFSIPASRHSGGDK